MSLATQWRRDRRRASWWVVVCLLGLSVGASVAVVLVFRQVVVKPVPGPAPERVVTMGGLAFGDGIGDPIAWWQTESLEHLARYTSGDIVIEGSGLAARWIRLSVVSGAFFDVFGQAPLSGRALTRADEASGQRAIVLREDVWRRLRRDEPDEGAQVRLNGEPYTVVGVVPNTFRFPSESQAWITHAEALGPRVSLVQGIGELPAVRSEMGWIGRLERGASVRQVQDQLVARLRATNATLTPRTGVSYGNIVEASLLQERLAATVKTPLTLLLLSTSVILLLALANCVLYAFTIAADRRGEVALRICLGATRARIWRELLWDSLLLVLIGAAVSISASWLMVSVSRWLLSAYLVHIPPFALALPAALTLTIVAAVVVGALMSIPSLLVARTAVLTRSSGEGAARPSTRRRLWGHRLFVAGTAAASTLLVAGALTANLTFARAVGAPLGHVSNVMATRMVYTGQDAVGEGFAHKRKALLAAGRAAGTPAAVTSSMPITSAARRFQQVAFGGAGVMAAVTNVEGEFFQVMGVPVLQGRAEDLATGTSVAVNRSLATHFWGSGSAAIGQRLAVGGPGEHWSVVAIVEDSRTVDQRDQTVYELYRPFEAPSGDAAAVEVLTACRSACAGEMNAIVDAIRRGVPGGQLVRANTVAALEWNARAGAIVSAAVWSVFALLAGAIAVASSATLAANDIVRRKREIGVRSALGALPNHLAWALTTGSLLSLAVGTLAGLVMTNQALTIVQSVTEGVEAPTHMALLAASTIVIGGGAVAAHIVARRASRQPVSDLLRTT